jgi:bacterioferritin
MDKEGIDKAAVVAALNRIMETELAGVVRYTHYSLMIFGYNRIPIVSWMRGQATESLTHAQNAGEKITHLAEHPRLGVAPLAFDPTRHDLGDILRESLEHEKHGLALYRDLLALVEGRSAFLEEYARQMVYEEETHVGEVEKMLRRPA